MNFAGILIYHISGKLFTNNDWRDIHLHKYNEYLICTCEIVNSSFVNIFNVALNQIVKIDKILTQHLFEFRCCHRSSSRSVESYVDVQSKKMPGRSIYLCWNHSRYHGKYLTSLIIVLEYSYDKIRVAQADIFRIFKIADVRTNYSHGYFLYQVCLNLETGINEMGIDGCVGKRYNNRSKNMNFTR